MGRIDRISYAYSETLFSIIITRRSHLMVLYVTQAWIRVGGGNRGVGVVVVVRVVERPFDIKELIFKGSRCQIFTM